MKRDQPRTRVSLVEGMKRDEDKAWGVFYSDYSPLVRAFASKRGCPPDMAEDVIQETAIALRRHLKEFIFDKDKGRFRSLLFRIVESKVIDQFRKSRKIDKLKESELFALGKEAEPSNESKRLWDAEWEENLLRMSIEKVRHKIKPQTYECFKRSFLEGKSVAEVADSLGISANLVSQHKFKVFKLIIDAAHKLLE